MLGSTPRTYVVVSPLAEGADRIVAHQVLAASTSDGMPAPSLEAVLPLADRDYVEDFATIQSQQEFAQLLSCARAVERISPQESRAAAYQAAGQFVVDHCDILIAIWDGMPAAGLGGTAEVVKYAHQIGRSLWLIHPETGTVMLNPGPDQSLNGFASLRAFNREDLGTVAVQKEIEANYSRLALHAASSSLPADRLQSLCDHLLPMFVRADLLAQRYQSRFTKAGSAVYTLAAISVGIVTLQTFFLPHQPELVWFEFIAMGLVLFFVFISHRRDWHRKWIDYRFLAERLRTALYLSVAGIECEVPKPPPHLRLSHRSDDWMIRALGWIWNNRPRLQPLPLESFQALRSFMIAAWVDDQRKFYVITSKLHDRRQERLEWLGWAVFLLAFTAAGVHSSGLAELALPEGISSEILVSIAILFPVIGASAGGIRAHREYLRSSERYRHMAEHLATLIVEIKRAPDLEALTQLLEQVNRVMLLENQDWRALVLTQELHPG
jgi:hypothetical protein